MDMKRALTTSFSVLRSPNDKIFWDVCLKSRVFIQMFSRNLHLTKGPMRFWWLSEESRLTGTRKPHGVPGVSIASLVPQMVPGAGSVPAIQRIPLPGAEMLEEEPLYVNAKQYHRILKRRQARAKLEAEGKIPKERRVGEIRRPRTGMAGFCS